MIEQEQRNLWLQRWEKDVKAKLLGGSLLTNPRNISSFELVSRHCTDNLEQEKRPLAFVTFLIFGK